MLALSNMREREQLLARKIAHRQANAGIAVDELQVCSQSQPSSGTWWGGETFHQALAMKH